jgi:hypothetical protein
MLEFEDLPRWLGAGLSTNKSLGLGALKTDLSKRGVSSRGWRLYLDHGDALFNPLRKNWLDKQALSKQASAAVDWLCVVQACEMDVLPPHELVASIGEWKLPGGQLNAIPPLFLRAAWKATVLAQYTDANVTDFLRNEVIPLAQWFFQSGSYQSAGPDNLKAGWESLKRLRRESVIVEAQKLSQNDWPPIIRKFESGPFVMLALCNESELVAEGEAMDHCVGTFGDICRFQPLRIFSIQQKKNKQRVATLAIKEFKSGHWEVNQLKGPSNADAGPGLWEEIDGLLQIVNAVSRRDAKLRKFLDFIHTLATARHS